jgi:hypothetical protein
MKNYFKKNDEENFEYMDSTFTPIGSEYFKNPTILAKSKIEEIKDLKKSKFEEVKD